MKNKYLHTIAVFLFSLQACNKPTSVPQQNNKTDLSHRIRYVSNSNMADEWNVYKEMSGFGAYEFRFSDGFTGYGYEIKLLTFQDGRQTGTVYFDKIKLSSSFLNSAGKPGFFKFYTYRKSDTEEIFRIDPYPQTQYSILLNIIGSRSSYKWTPLHNDNDSNANIETNQWYAIATFGQQPHVPGEPEKCVYCMLPDYKTHYEQWYEKFGIAHYYVVLLRMVH